MTAGSVNPERILQELQQLWVSLADQTKEENLSGVVRACSMTLVVVEQRTERAPAAGGILAELMQAHPSRAIVVGLSPDAGGRLASRVFAQCWLPFGHRRQLCSEQIEIEAGAESLFDLPALLRALEAPDLPVVVWCRSPELLRWPEFRAVSNLADRLIADSSTLEDPEWLLAEFDAALGEGRAVADLAWTSLTRWRETIAQAFESPGCRRRAREVTEVRLTYAGPPVSSPACYMAGWLAHALGWPADDDRLKLEATPESQRGRLLAVKVAAPRMTVSIHARGERAVDVSVNGLLQQTFFPPLSEADLLAEELSISGRDAAYERGLETALRFAGGRRS